MFWRRDLIYGEEIQYQLSIARNNQMNATPSKNRVVAVCWLGTALVSFDYTAVTIALPELSRYFEAGTSEVSWLSLGYLASLATFLLPSTSLLGHLGLRRTLAASFCVFAFASLGCMLSRDLTLLVAFRVLQGAAGAIIYVAGPIFIQALVPKNQRADSFRIFATAGPAGLCAGPLIGGLITELVGWQFIFLFNIPLAALALFLLKPGNWSYGDAGRHAPNLLSLSIMACGTLALVLALNQGKEWGWSSPPILGLLAASGLLLALTNQLERKVKNRIFPPGLLRVQSFKFGTIAIFIFLVTFGGLVFLLPFFLQWQLALGPGSTGLLLAVQPTTAAVGAVLASSVFLRWQAQTIALLGLGVFAVGLLLLASPLGASNTTVLVFALACAGAGSGLIIPCVFQILMSELEEPLIFSGTALQSFGRILGQLIGVVSFETIFSQLSSSVFHRHVTGNQLYGYTAAFLFGLVCVVISGILVLKTRKNAAAETGKENKNE
jgi:MFS family permease